MKKHKILIVALALAVMCTGAGYAYWTQTLTIAICHFQVRMDDSFIDPADVDWETNNYLDPWNRHSNNVTVSAIIAGNGQSLDFTVENFYPGAGASLGFVVENSGSVAAKITNITGTIKKNAALCDAFDYKFNKVEVYRTPIFGIPYLELIIDVPANNVSDLASGLTNALKDIILEPGDILVLKSDGLLSTGIGGEEESPGYEILMSKDITGHQYEKETAKFTLALDFTQVN